MPKPNQINDLVGRASLLRKLKIYINQQLTLEFLLPLDHQQLTQVRVVKGICFDRHRPLPSLLPSEKQVLCWRGFTRHRLIINQHLGYRSQSRSEQVGLLGKLLRIGLLQLRQVVQLPADAR